MKKLLAFSFCLFCVGYVFGMKTEEVVEIRENTNSSGSDLGNTCDFVVFPLYRTEGELSLDEALDELTAYADRELIQQTWDMMSDIDKYWDTLNKLGYRFVSENDSSRMSGGFSYSTYIHIPNDSKCITGYVYNFLDFFRAYRSIIKFLNRSLPTDRSCCSISFAQLPNRMNRVEIRCRKDEKNPCDYLLLALLQRILETSIILEVCDVHYKMAKVLNNIGSMAGIQDESRLLPYLNNLVKECENRSDGGSSCTIL